MIDSNGIIIWAISLGHFEVTCPAKRGKVVKGFSEVHRSPLLRMKPVT